jgi:hypothetical protein
VIGRDSFQPGGQWTIRIEAVDGPESLEKGFLGGIFGFGTAADQTVGDIENGRLVTTHQFAKRFHVTSLGAYYQFPITGYRHR